MAGQSRPAASSPPSALWEHDLEEFERARQMLAKYSAMAEADVATLDLFHAKPMKTTDYAAPKRGAERFRRVQVVKPTCEARLRSEVPYRQLSPRTALVSERLAGVSAPTSHHPAKQLIVKGLVPRPHSARARLMGSSAVAGATTPSFARLNVAPPAIPPPSSPAVPEVPAPVDDAAAESMPTAELEPSEVEPTGAPPSSVLPKPVPISAAPPAKLGARLVQATWRQGWRESRRQRERHVATEMAQQREAQDKVNNEAIGMRNALRDLYMERRRDLHDLEAELALLKERACIDGNGRNELMHRAGELEGRCAMAAEQAALEEELTLTRQYMEARLRARRPHLDRKLAFLRSELIVLSVSHAEQLEAMEVATAYAERMAARLEEEKGLVSAKRAANDAQRDHLRAQLANQGSARRLRQIEAMSGATSAIQMTHLQAQVQACACHLQAVTWAIPIAPAPANCHLQDAPCPCVCARAQTACAWTCTGGGGARRAHGAGERRGGGSGIQGAGHV